MGKAGERSVRSCLQFSRRPQVQAAAQRRGHPFLDGLPGQRVPKAVSAFLELEQQR